MEKSSLEYCINIYYLPNETINMEQEITIKFLHIEGDSTEEFNKYFIELLINFYATENTFCFNIYQAECHMRISRISFPSNRVKHVHFSIEYT